MPQLVLDLGSQYDNMMTWVLYGFYTMVFLASVHLLFKLTDEMSVKSVIYFYRLSSWNDVTGDQDINVSRFPGDHDLTVPFTELASNLSREYNGETESVTHLIRRHCLTAIYRVFLSKDDLEQLNYMGLVVATKLGHIRAMRQYLESGVKPTGLDGDIICMAPLLTAMRMGPETTKFLLEYGALSSKVARVQLDTDFIISSPMSVIKSLVEYGKIPSLSLSSLEEASRKFKGNNVKALKRIEDIKALVCQPLSLVSLARNSVADRLGPMPGRRMKLPSTGLPNIWQEELCLADRMDLSRAKTDDNSIEISFRIRRL